MHNIERRIAALEGPHHGPIDPEGELAKLCTSCGTTLDREIADHGSDGASILIALRQRIEDSEMSRVRTPGTPEDARVLRQCVEQRRSHAHIN